MGTAIIAMLHAGMQNELLMNNFLKIITFCDNRLSEDSPAGFSLKPNYDRNYSSLTINDSYQKFQERKMKLRQ